MGVAGQSVNEGLAAKRAGQYEVHILRPAMPGWSQVVVTTVYVHSIPPGPQGFTERVAEWFVISAIHDAPVSSQALVMPAGSSNGDQVTDAQMLKAALDEATATIPSQVQSQPVAIEKKQEPHDLFVSYWIRGVCADGLRTIHAQTGCAALKQDLGTILSLPPLSKKALPLKEPGAP
jgi:hypothetical protein